jgi:hypothetical protein
MTLRGLFKRGVVALVDLIRAWSDGGHGGEMNLEMMERGGRIRPRALLGGDGIGRTGKRRRRCTDA